MEATFDYGQSRQKSAKRLKRRFLPLMQSEIVSQQDKTRHQISGYTRNRLQNKAHRQLPNTLNEMLNRKFKSHSSEK